MAEWLGATFEGDGEKELTAVAPLRFVPLMVTAVPPRVEPLVGVMLLTVGAGMTTGLIGTAAMAHRAVALAVQLMVTELPLAGLVLAADTVLKSVEELV